MSARRLVGVLACALVLAACSEGSDCRPGEGRLCISGDLWLLDSCLQPVALVGHCDCGCLADATGCAPCDPTCEPDSCSGHGTCDDAGGAIACSCDPAYAGAACQECAPGYQDLDGDGTCLPVSPQTCAELSCGARSGCVESAAGASCECVTGHQGAGCAECETGFQDLDGDGICLPSCAAAGLECGLHGACADAGGLAACACAPGWAGTFCDGCAAGFHDPGDGTCAEDTWCGPLTCNRAGTCQDLPGGPACTCRAGHTGAHCEACLPGYAMDGHGDFCRALDCVGFAGPCSGHGTCMVSDTDAYCLCAPGFDPEGFCQGCLPGLHVEGDACLADTTCEARTCNGLGACDDTGGTPVCQCEPGYQGTHCERGSYLRGSVGLFCSRTANPEASFESTSFSAYFADYPSPGGSPRVVGPCSFPSGEPYRGPARVFTAGDLSVAGGRWDLQATLLTTVEGPEYDRYLPEMLFEGGELLVFQATGDPDGVPAWAAELRAPHPATPTGYDGLPWPTGFEAIGLDPASDHTFTWSGGVDGDRLVFSFQGPDYAAASCAFDAGVGAGTIPAQAIQELAALGIYLVSVNTVARRELQAGDFVLTVSARMENGPGAVEVAFP